MDTVRNRIKRRIKVLVEMEGGTTAFASRIGTSKQAVNNWVNGKSAPDIETIDKIADEFGLTLEALIRDDGIFEYMVDSEIEDRILSGEVSSLPDASLSDELREKMSKLNTLGVEKLKSYADGLLESGEFRC